MGGWENSSDPYAKRVVEGYKVLEEYFRLQDAGEPADPEAMLAGVPGVRLAPVTWEELLALVAAGGAEALGKLGRSPEQLRQYWAYRDGVIKSKFVSVTDYLYWKVFGLETRPDEAQGSRLAAVVPPDFAASRRTVWRDNDFPYLVEPGVQHLNYWSSQPLSDAEVEQRIAAELPPGAESCHFVNPPVLQSVPSIWHAHIFWRLEPAVGRQQGEQAALGEQEVAKQVAAATQERQQEGGRQGQREERQQPVAG